MDDRAVSSTLNYVMSLAIAAILVTGLLFAGGSFVEDRREEVIRNEMNVIGQQIAADLERADRLVEAGDGSTTVEVTQEFPQRITGSPYAVHLESAPVDRLVLRSADPEVEVTVRVDTQTALDPSRAEGGRVVVRYDQGSNRLVVDDA